ALLPVLRSVRSTWPSGVSGSDGCTSSGPPTAYTTKRTPFAGPPGSLDATYPFAVVSQTKVFPSVPGAKSAAVMPWERGAARGTPPGNGQRPSGGRATDAAGR